MTRRTTPPVPILAGLALLLLLARAAAALPVASALACLDADAGAESASVAGAVFLVDLDATPGASPPTLATGVAGPWHSLSGLARLPDGQYRVSDLGAQAGTAADGRVFSVSAAGAVQLVSSHAWLREPADLAVGAAGVVLIADPAADPSGLGPDAGGADGHGAVFRLDAAGALTLVADGTDHSVPGVAAGVSAFESPVAVAYEAATGTTFVIDRDAIVAGSAGIGALYAVDGSGHVSLVSADDEFYDLVDVALLSDGSLLVLDGEQGNSRLYRVERGAAYPTRGAALVTDGPQHAKLEGVAVGPFDEVYVVDSGLFDPVLGGFRRRPAVRRIEQHLPRRQNAVTLNDGAVLLRPLQLAVVPVVADTGLAVSAALPLSGGTAVVQLALAGTCSRAPWDICPVRVEPGALGQASVPLTRSQVPALTLLRHSDPVSDMTLERQADSLLAR